MIDFEPQDLNHEWVEELLTCVTDEELEDATKHSLVPFKEQVLYEGVPYTATVRDSKGDEYIDCTAQAWTLNVGYVNPDVLYTVAYQMKRLTHVRYGYPTVPRIKLLNKLASMFGERFQKICFNNEGGGFGIEGAMKLAMVYKGPPHTTFITAWRGYHGSSLALLPASAWLPVITRFPGYGIDRYVKAPYPYCYRCPLGLEEESCDLGCLKMMEGTMRHSVNAPIAGVIIEPIQGPGGHVPAPRKYLEGLRELCTRFDIPLIFDESQTGWGRVGAWCASDLYGVYPDMIVFTKAIGGGFPLGVLMTDERFPDFTEAEEHTTFGSNPVMMAAALANIEVIERMGLVERSKKLGEKITARLRELQGAYDIIGDIRCPGLYIGVELVEDRETKKPSFPMASEFIKEGTRNGVIYDLSMPDLFLDGVSGRNVIKIKPPLTITDSEVEKVLEVFEICLKHVSKMKQGG